MTDCEGVPRPFSLFLPLALVALFTLDRMSGLRQPAVAVLLNAALYALFAYVIHITTGDLHVALVETNDLDESILANFSSGGGIGGSAPNVSTQNQPVRYAPALRQLTVWALWTTSPAAWLAWVLCLGCALLHLRQVVSPTTRFGNITRRALISRVESQNDAEILKFAHTEDWQLHAAATHVLTVPVAYAAMAFRACMWQLRASSGVPVQAIHCRCSGNERCRLKLEKYFSELNMHFADFYEAWALLHFGSIALTVITRKTRHGDRFALRAVNELATYGISMFAISCGCVSLTYQILTWIFWWFPESYWHIHDKMDKYEVHGMFTGATFVASFAAIGNIMLLEKVFQTALHEIGAAPKFLTTKCLVTLASIQEVALPIIFRAGLDVPEGHSSLLTSVLICLESCVVAVFHCRQWSYKERWYKLEPDQGDNPFEAREMDFVNLSGDTDSRQLPVE